MTERVVDTVRLHLPVPLTVSVVRAALTALATVSGQPRVVLEAHGSQGAVSWYLACERAVMGRVLRAIGDQIPGFRADRLPNAASRRPTHQAARVRYRGDHRLPLAAEAAEPAARGLLGALSRAGDHEHVILQLVLGPRLSPGGPTPQPSRQRRFMEFKQQQHRVQCEMRIGAASADPARTRSLVESVAATLRTLEVPGVWLRLTRARPVDLDHGRSPFLWGNRLAVSDLVPLTAWPLGPLPLPGVPDPHPRLLPVPPQVPRSGRVVGGSRLHPARDVAMTVSDSLRHLHLLGPTGTGKSTLLAQLALQDMAAGRGVVVIDPKGDLVDEILTRAPEARHADIVVLDARDASPVGINGLHDPTDPGLTADTLLSVFHSLYADSWGPRTQDILHACLLTLARRGDASLAMVPLLLTNSGFRRSVVARAVVQDPMGLGAFWSWFDGISDAERTQAIAPLMNKLRPVLLRPGIRGVFGQRRPRFDLDQVFTERKVLLVNLAKGQLGADAAQLLGALVIALLWSAALRRAGSHAAQHQPVMVHIDEVQDYLRLPGDLGDALAQARGLGVGFTLAHQHLGQLPTSLREAVLANARSRVAFGLTGRDARDVAALSRGQIEPDDLAALPAFNAYGSLLVQGGPSPWISLVTRPLPPRTHTPELLRRASRERYGRPLADIEADLLSLLDRKQSVSGETLGRTRRTPSEAADD